MESLGHFLLLAFSKDSQTSPVLNLQVCKEMVRLLHMLRRTLGIREQGQPQWLLHNCKTFHLMIHRQERRRGATDNTHSCPPCPPRKQQARARQEYPQKGQTCWILIELTSREWRLHRRMYDRAVLEDSHLPH